MRKAYDHKDNKQHAMKKLIGQQWNQRGNLKVFDTSDNKNTTIQKSMGCKKSSCVEESS